MATVKPPRNLHAARRPGPRQHYLRNAVIAVVLLAALAITVLWPRLQAQAVLATSYGARIACSCHYIAGRDLQDCRKDFEPGMALVTLRDNAPTRSITARVPLLATQTATYRDGPGCQLQPWTP